MTTTESGWNFADLWETVASQIPDALAQQQGARAYSWAEFNRRANGVAAALLRTDSAEQDKIAQYLYNSPEYLESMFAAFKAGLAVVNTNYRYAADELVYLWDNADATTVVFHGTFTDQCDAIRERVPKVQTWLWVDDGSGGCPDWATPYEDAAQSGTDDDVHAPWGRSGDHLLLLYTGGTTGMPKGVMWRQDDLFGVLDANNKKRMPPEQDLVAVAERVVKAGPRNMPAAPLMHGTGLFNAISNLMVGGSITTMEGRHFSAEEFLDTVQQYGINSTSIVGDAFAKPILRALDGEPDRWDISTLRVVVSSGVMWSKETKQGLLRHNPRLIMVDSLGSSEAIGMASNTTTSESSGETAKFELGPTTRVITDEGRDVVPGSGELGRVALPGRTPIGYYKDEAKSAQTFVVIDGERYSIPGDYATVEADGTVTLLGRGSQCINTGGEKVYPEEVEECLKLHPTVADAAVVGVPDEKWGEAITALVEPHAHDVVDEAELIAHVKSRLAAYKAPKRIVAVSSIGRAANGKLDYKSLRSAAITDTAVSPVRVQRPGADFDWRQHAGVLFDLDGVITPTAEVHEHAWGELFADFDYTEADYLRYIDGKPRYDGVRSFLASRDITLPDGHPEDPPGDDTVCAMGNRKNELFNTILERDGVEPYPSSIATLDLLDEAGVPSAIVSSSKNARNVLDAAGLGERFDVVVDGVVAATEHIAGKPAPDMFLHAARRLGVEPDRTVVVEDAVSGVAAGAAGGFAVVIGVDRGAGAATLLDHGADFVVDDLADLLADDGPSGQVDG